MQKSFDINGDGEITWNEAAGSIYKLTKEMKSGNRDVWVSIFVATALEIVFFNVLSMSDWIGG